MSYNELKQHGTEDFPIELYHIEKEHARYEMSAHWHSEIELIRVLSGVLHALEKMQRLPELSIVREH